MFLTHEESVFEALKAGIVEGAVPVGGFLSQRKLATQFNTSLITLRAALRRLENHGLIENVPRWGVRIPEDTSEDVSDRYFVRETIELAALKRALPRMDEEQRARLLDLAAECDRVEETDDAALRRFADAHMALHRCLVEYADSPLLLDQYERLMARSLMLTNARRVWGQGDRGPEHHRALATELLGGSLANAVAALRAHIRRGLERELLELDREVDNEENTP